MGVASESGSDRIDRLLESCLELPPSAWIQRIEQLCTEFPEHAPELRRRYEEILSLGILGSQIEQDLATGRRVGRYLIRRRLGAGGMAVVYLAEAEESQEPVALKLIRREFLEVASIRERFQRELKAAAEIDHPHLCRVFDVGEAEGMPYLAMSYLEGPSLAQWIASGRNASHERICSWFAKLATALHEVHDHGFVHRDVKPGNIMFTSAFEPKLLDFGLSHVLDDKASHELTLSGAIVGTPAYMAPEQIRGELALIRPMTDVYGIGVTLYESLSGKRPFEAPTREALYRKILESDAVPLRQLDSRIPKDLSLVVSTAMAREPAERYRNAELLASDLRRIVEGKAVRVRPPGLWTRTRRYARRHRVASTMIWALLLLVLLGGIGLSGFWRALAREHSLSLVRASQLAESRSPRHALVLAQQARESRDDLATRSQLLRARAIQFPGKVFRGHESDIYGVDVSADGRLLASGANDNSLCLWELQTGRQLWSRRCSPLPATESTTTTGRTRTTVRRDPVLAVHFLGDRLVSCTLAGEIRLWDLEGSMLAQVSAATPETKARHKDVLRNAAVAADRKLLLVGGWRFARLYDLNSDRFEAVGPMLEHDYYVGGLAFDPTGSFFATGDAGLGMGNETAARYALRLWRRTNEGVELVRVLDSGIQMYGELEFSPDGRLLASGGRGRALLFDLDAKSRVELLPEAGLASFRFLAKRRYFGESRWFLVLASWHGLVEIHDETGQSLLGTNRLGTNVLQVKASLDGRSFACACTDNTTRVFNWNNEPIATLIGHGERVLRLAFVPGGGRLVSSSDDDTLRSWALEDPPNRCWPLTSENWLVRTVPGTNQLLCAPSLGPAMLVTEAGERRKLGFVRTCAHFGDAPALPSSAGPWVVSANLDAKSRRFVVSVLDLRDGQSLGRILVPGSECGRISFAPLRTGPEVFVATLDHLYLWDGRSAEAEEITTGAYPFVLAGPGRQALIHAEERAQILSESADGSWQRREIGPGFYRAAWSQRGETIGLVTGDGWVHLLHPDGSRRCPRFRSGKSDPLSISISPDEAWVVVVSRDGVARVFDTSGRAWLELSLPGAEARDACFSEDSHFVYTAHADGRLTRWPLQLED